MEVLRRRIRISFSDPDATDSDSGEDASSASASCGKTKVVILHCTSSSSSAKKNPGGCGSQQRKQAIRSFSSCRERAVGSPVPVMKRCRGVYERQPGRWAAEFRSHRLKARHWIGTFATEEEAKVAYDDFERQFVPSRRCGLPLPLPHPALERGGRAAGGVHRSSHPHRQRRHPHPPDTEKRQIVQALTATGIMLPPLRRSAPAAIAPCISSSTSASPPPPPPPLGPAPPTGFENADALPSVHSFWADEPADEDLVGLADLGHLPLPFSDGSMDFNPADLSLFDGFL